MRIANRKNINIDISPAINVQIGPLSLASCFISIRKTRKENRIPKDTKEIPRQLNIVVDTHQQERQKLQR